MPAPTKLDSDNYYTRFLGFVNPLGEKSWVGIDFSLGEVYHIK